MQPTASTLWLVGSTVTLTFQIDPTMVSKLSYLNIREFTHSATLIQFLELNNTNSPTNPFVAILNNAAGIVPTAAIVSFSFVVPDVPVGNNYAVMVWGPYVNAPLGSSFYYAIYGPTFGIASNAVIGVLLSLSHCVDIK